MRSSSDPTVLRRQRLGVAGVAVAALAAIALLGAWAGDLWEAGQADGAADAASDGDVGFVPSLDGPVISEVMSSNGSTLADEDGDHPDWIELYNPSGEPVDLAGYFLSDDDEEPDRWKLPSVTLEPGGFLVVFASGKDRDDPSGELHTDFRVAQGDEPVLLVAPDGETVVDRLPGEDVPRDASIGRDPEDLARVCLFAEPTPGEPNVPACFDDTELGAPRLSHSSGFYDDPFELEISVDDPDATIIYTLDGSFPDLEANPDRTFTYDGALLIEDRTPQPNTISTIDATVPSDEVEWNVPDPPVLDEPIPKATVLRARSLYSAERTATYFVGEHLRRDELPVISLALDPEYLFDHDRGIYVAGRLFEEYRDSPDFNPAAGWPTPANYNGRGREWEVPWQGLLRRSVVLEHCEPQAGCLYQTNVGLRVHGRATRRFPQKSLRLYARNDYGHRTFDHAFWGEDGPVGHRRVLLRSSGQDVNYTMLRDGYLQSLLGSFEADTQAYQPAVLFINGEYWGIHNLRERYDRHYLGVVHGADPDEVVILSSELAEPLEVEAGAHDAGAPFRELLEFLAEADPADPATLERVESEVDLDSFFDLIIAQAALGVWDFPGANVRMWRSSAPTLEVGEGVLDGRWRWLIFDLDHAGQRAWRNNVEYDVFKQHLAPEDDLDEQGGFPFMFHRLMENPEARARYLARSADHLNATFDPARTIPRLDDLEVLLEDEMVHHLERWSPDRAIDAWYEQVDALRVFMEQRPDVHRQHLVELFGLSGTAEVEIRTDATAGAVRVNGRDLSASGSGERPRWQGTYFEGVPIELEAIPAAGYRFVRWNGLPRAEAAEEAVEVVLDGDLRLEPIFERG